MTVDAYPLHWPANFPRTVKGDRQPARLPPLNGQQHRQCCTQNNLDSHLGAGLAGVVPVGAYGLGPLNRLTRPPMMRPISAMCSVTIFSRLALR